MDNSSQSGAGQLEPGGVAAAAMRAGGQLAQDLLGGGQSAADPNAIQPPVDSIDRLPCFKDLIAVLVECFTIISLGYLSGRFKLISPEAKDLGTYLTTFALPMIIFLNIAQMEFQTINVAFLFCMLISKLLLFVLVSLITLTISYPANFSFAGALSILATQSNDFALGYPLIKSLYGETRPEMLNYLNLMGPIQLLIINPLGIIMLEYEKSRKNRRLRRRLNLASHREHCGPSASNGPDDGSDKPLGTEQRQQQVIKTYQEQFISSQAALTGSRATGQRVRAQAPGILEASERQQLGGSLINSAPTESVVIAGGKCSSSLASHSEDAQLEMPQQRQLRQGKPLTVNGINGFKRKNIKSLTLVMPETMVARRDSSADSSAASLDFNGNAVERAGSMRGPDQTRCSQPGAQRVASSPLPIMQDGSPISGPASERIVYTRPKVVNSLTSSKWLSRATGTASGPVAGTSHQADNADDTAPMQNLVAADQDCGHQKRRPSNCDCCAGGAEMDTDSKLDLSFVRALLTNPLIIASVLALAVNLINGPELPKIVTKVSNTIAASFAAPALFVVGLSMFGNFRLIVTNPNDFLLSSVLVATKVLVLPSIMRTVVMLILPHYAKTQEVPHLADFSFLYGLLPTAPGACIIAKQYEVLSNVMSMCMLLSTIISAPLMLATSALINQAASIKPEDMVSFVAQTLRASSGLTLVLSLLTMYLLWKANRRANLANFFGPIERILDSASKLRANHLFTCLLVLAQLFVGLGGTMWLFSGSAKLNSELSESIGGERWQVSPHDDEELLANEGQHTLHNRIITPGSHGFFVYSETTPGSRASDESTLTNVICMLQYIFASGGILMARFVVLCIVLTNFAKRYDGHRFGARVFGLMMKFYPLVGLAIILNLVFESQRLTHLPYEASLPTWSFSIYLRLAFNTIILLFAIPLFAATFRLENRAAWLRAQEPAADDEPANLKHQRLFKQSSVSLTSETSSAITTSTNLDSSQQHQLASISARNSANPRLPLEQTAEQQQPPGALGDSLGATLGATLTGGEPNYVNTRQQRPELSPGRPDRDENKATSHNDIDHRRVQRPERVAIDLGSQCHVISDNWSHGDCCNSTSSNYDNSSAELSLSQQRDLIRLAGPARSHASGQQNSANKTLAQETSQAVAETAEADPEQEGGQLQQAQSWSAPISLAVRACADFDKLSVLIVFMLFQTLLNVTAMIQQLSQTSSYGTFLMIETANVAFDFGQGLMTFLIVGLRLLPLDGLVAPVTRTLV